MGVDVSFSLCFGVVIEDNDILNKIKQRIELESDNPDDLDNWDKWSQPIDCYISDLGYVVGIISFACEWGKVRSLKKDALILDPKEEQKFLDFYNKYRLYDFFEWQPELLAVGFVR